MRLKTSGQNRPTIPILRLLPGRPRRVFFSGAAFLGGIPRFGFAERAQEVEKEDRKREKEKSK